MRLIRTVGSQARRRSGAAVLRGIVPHSRRISAQLLPWRDRDADGDIGGVGRRDRPERPDSEWSNSGSSAHLWSRSTADRKPQRHGSRYSGQCDSPSRPTRGSVRFTACLRPTFAARSNMSMIAVASSRSAVDARARRQPGQRCAVLGGDRRRVIMAFAVPISGRARVLRIAAADSRPGPGAERIAAGERPPARRAGRRTFRCAFGLVQPHGPGPDRAPTTTQHSAPTWTRPAARLLEQGDDGVRGAAHGVP